MAIVNASRPRWAFSLIALAVVLLMLDLLTKELAVRHMAFGEAIDLTSFLRFVHVHNSGAAFGMLANQGPWAQWFLTLTGLLVCVWIVWRLCHPRRGEALFEAGLALVLGGALGNLTDRLRFGYVVDFIDFHYQGWHWPAFNLADTAITLGVIVLLIDLTGAFRRR
jgi:signal peptidase II